MAGLADLFGMGGDSGGMFGGGTGGLYGDLLTPEMKQQMAFRGLMAAAGALGQAAMPSRMPVPIGAALGQAAAAMAGAQDQGLENALKTALTGGKLQELKAKIELQKQLTSGQEPPMFASTPSGAPQPLVPAPVAPGADTLGSGGVPKAVSTMTADATMDPVQRAFLDSIAGPESSGAYNIRYTPGGGTTFSGYDAHPNIPEPGPQGPSTAAGRYQIVNSTWKPLAGQLGLSDFSPVSQDQAAWTLASDTYQKSTGRDLLADLKAGRTQDIPSALGGQWPTIRRALPAFAANLAKYGTAGGDTTLPAVPDFSGMMSGNQGPGYASAAAEPTAPGNLNPGNFNVGRLIMDPSVPNTPAGRAAAAPMSQLSAGYADAVSKGFRGTIQDYAQQQQAAPASAPAAPIAQPAQAAPVQVAQTGPLTSLPSASPPASVLPAAAALSSTPPPAQSPYGGVNPAYIQWAQTQARLRTALGIAVPAHISEAAKLPLDYAAPGANPALQGQIAGAQAGAKYPYDVLTKTLEADLARRNALAQQGINLGPGGVNLPAPGFQETTVSLERAKADAVARAQQAAIQQREQAMARFNLDPNAIGSQPAAPVDVGGGLRTGGAAPVPAGQNPVDVAAAAVKSGAPYGPGITEPIPTSHGTVIPPVTEAAPIVGSPKYLEQKQAGKGGWAETENDWAASRPMAKKAEEAALVVADVLKTYQSGAFAGQLSDIRAKLRAVGIDLPESVAGDPAAAQKIVKQNFSQTISSMKGFDSNPAAYQIKLAFENWANTNLQPEANLAILAQSVGLARWQEKLQQDFGEAKKLGWRDPQDFMLKWDQLPQNSLKSFVERATQEIGPLKGGPGSPPGGTPRRSYFDPKTGTIRPME